MHPAVILLWTATAAGALLALVSCALGLFSVHIPRQTLAQARDWQAAHYDISWYERNPPETYAVTMPDGYEIHAQWLPCPSDSDRCVIISHGYTDNRYGALKYAKIYLDAGCHVLLYDLRGHGENRPACCTYSARERKDLAALIRDTRRRHTELRAVGLHGESLGAATSVAVLGEGEEVSFVVADCGFAEILPVLRVGLRKMHLPGWLTHTASPFARLRCGFSYRDMRPIDALPGNRVPMLFMHGAADDFIVPAHSERMARATAGRSEVCLIPGAGHAASVLTDPALYRATVTAFLDKALTPDADAAEKKRNM